MRLLYVCLGNICRSPSAEAVMRSKVPEWTHDSAGTAGWHVGDAPYGPMQDAANTRGYDLAPLRARQFSKADFENFDVIFAMDRENLNDIQAQRPGKNSTPVLLFAENCDVPDPYYTRDFDGCIRMIEDEADRIIRTLRETY